MTNNRRWRPSPTTSVILLVMCGIWWGLIFATACPAQDGANDVLAGTQRHYTEVVQTPIEGGAAQRIEHHLLIAQTRSVVVIYVGTEGDPVPHWRLSMGGVHSFYSDGLFCLVVDKVQGSRSDFVGKRICFVFDPEASTMARVTDGMILHDCGIDHTDPSAAQAQLRLRRL